MKKPGFWRLVGAYGVDFVILQIISGICMKIKYLLVLKEQNAYCSSALARCLPSLHFEGQHHPFIEYFELESLNSFWWDWGQSLLIILFLCWGYFAVFDGIFGKTPGKHFFAIKTIPPTGTKFPFLRNVFAYLIDSVVVIPVSLVIAIALGACLVKFSLVPLDSTLTAWFMGVLCVLMIFLLPVLYYSCYDSRRGTLGKKLMGLQVVQEEKTK